MYLIIKSIESIFLLYYLAFTISTSICELDFFNRFHRLKNERREKVLSWYQAHSIIFPGVRCNKSFEKKEKGKRRKEKKAKVGRVRE